MKHQTWRLLALACALALAGAAQAQTQTQPQPQPQPQTQRVLRLISDRTDQGLMRPIIEGFEAKTGHKIEGVFMDQGLVNRLESRPTEADVIITKDAELLELAAERGLLDTIASAKIKASIPAEFMGPKDQFFVDAYRARVIYYSKARVKPSELAGYEDLAHPKWKGRICMRSGSHDYNLALFGMMVASYGEAKGRAVIKGISENLARAPKGNDREQGRALFEGKCDVAIMNTYYHPMMAANPEQKPWADAAGMHFPGQAGKGTFIMRSAAALTKATGNRDLAVQLLEYIASREGQEAMVKATRQYSVLPDVPAHPLMVQLGAEQGLKDGRFKVDFVPLRLIAGKREEMIKLVNELRFDDHY